MPLPLSSRLVRYFRRKRADVSAAAFKLAFGTLVTAAALAATYAASESSLSGSEAGVLLALGVAINGVLMLVALVILRSKTAANAVSALVTLGSVFTAYIVHTELYVPENRAALIVICSAALFGLFVAFRIIDEHRWGGWALSGPAAIGVMAIVWPEIRPDLVRGFSTPGGVLAPEDPRFWAALIGIGGAGLLALFVTPRIIDVSRWGGVALLAAVLIVVVVVVWPGLIAEYAHVRGGVDVGDGWEKHPNVRAITFEETPNVYFIGFDSIVPESIMNKYMGVETTEFHEVLAGEARRFRNLFANGDGTSASFGALMALDLDIYLNGRRLALGEPRYFSGRDPSPLIWIMRENGYETTSIYNDTFFGRRQGPYIDNYIVNRKKWGICSLLDESIRRWAFWGYCKMLEASWPQDAVAPKGDFLLRELTNLDGSRPKFVIAHLWMPGHTGRFNYYDKEDRENYIEYYYRESNRAGLYLRQIIEHLRSNDPNAILFVFGDHGAKLSKGIKIEEDPTFFLQDRFGVLGGVYPRDRCAEYFDEAESKGYVTILDAVHAILSCLSGGQSALVEPRHDRFRGSGIPSDHEYHYKEFLYE